MCDLCNKKAICQIKFEINCPLHSCKKKEDPETHYHNLCETCFMKNKNQFNINFDINEAKKNLKKSIKIIKEFTEHSNKFFDLHGLKYPANFL